MDAKRGTKISKFLSLILRHKPETVGLSLEKEGWVEVGKLLEACAKKGTSFTLEELRDTVANNDKKRFSFDETGAKIRANQGHSLRVEIDFERKTPPEILYHGTAEKNVAKILERGLLKQTRHHVHLSTNIETARAVGIRHGKPVVFEIKTKSMIDENFEFFASANGVWLVETVPPKFLSILKK